MRVFDDHGRRIDLVANTFLARGGEATIYAKNGVAYKIAHDPANALPRAKLSELATARHPALVTPTSLVYDNKGALVGHAMPYRRGYEPICRLYPRAYRERHGIEQGDLIAIVMALAEAVDAAHQAGVFLVDLNELNVLHDGRDICVIDLDSAQTPSFSATALLPAVRDYSVPEGSFNEATDWFSFAVVTFPLFAGIHPYKGKHPDLTTLVSRMRGQVSVFDPAVRTPPTATVDAVPEPLRSWFEATFEAGHRGPPPSGPVAAVQVQRRVASGGIALHEVLAARGTIRQLVRRRGRWVAQTENGVEVDGRPVPLPGGGPITLGFSPRDNTPVALHIGGDGRFVLADLDRGRFHPLDLRPDAIATADDGRILLQAGDQLMELDIVEAAGCLPVLLPLAQVLPHATVLGHGAACQDMVGACWISVLPQRSVHHQLRVTDLDGRRVLALAAAGNVVVGITVDGARYDRFVLRHEPQVNRYDLRWVDDVGSAELQVVGLDTGVVACLDGRGILELFNCRRGDPRVHDIADPPVDLRLVPVDGKAGTLSERRLCRLEMR